MQPVTFGHRKWNPRLDSKINEIGDSCLQINDLTLQKQWSDPFKNHKIGDSCMQINDLTLSKQWNWLQLHANQWFGALKTMKLMTVACKSMKMLPTRPPRGPPFKSRFWRPCFFYRFSIKILLEINHFGPECNQWPLGTENETQGQTPQSMKLVTVACKSMIWPSKNNDLTLSKTIKLVTVACKSMIWPSQNNEIHDSCMQINGLAL
jgi:hypothetical protein